VKIDVPFFRPDIGDAEIQEVVATLQSGWLTTGPRVKQFEASFAAAVHATHAIALNSCTAALHLAVRALGLRPGDGVLVPAMTFAATAEVVQYEGGIPILVDCDPRTLNMDLSDAERKVSRLASGASLAGVPRHLHVAGMIPVHVGGMMMNIDDITAFARRHDLWVVEDAAHAFPAAWRRSSAESWQWCGQRTSSITCFSFYANKTITTGEGGMAVTDDADLARRLRSLSLHGLSHDAWNRYSGGSSWDYRIIEAGYKYNLTDIAAAIGIHQLARANSMREARESIAQEYIAHLSDIEEIELPAVDDERVHAWHLFPIRVRPAVPNLDRDSLLNTLRANGVSCSVHWRPLHLHPHYEQTFGWSAADLPIASEVWPRLVSLPIFSAMKAAEIEAVIGAVRSACTDVHRGERGPIVAVT
jgi:perosamine synthetase